MRRAIATIVSCIVLMQTPGAAAPYATPPGFDAQFTGESAFLALHPGETGQLTVFFVNTGSVTWVRGTSTEVALSVCVDTPPPQGFRCNVLSPYADFALGWTSPRSYAIPAQVSVSPGTIANFTYAIRVPPDAAFGDYYFRGELIHRATQTPIRPTGYYQVVSVIPLFSSELPIVLIDTLGGTIQNDPKIPATMKIIDGPPGAMNVIPSPGSDYRIGIELRGSLSATFCKKQYGFETWDAANNDVPLSLLGMPAESDWVLQGPYDDKTLIRNVLAYGLGTLVEGYAPRTRLVELFVKEAGSPSPGCPPLASDGYVGVYVVTEKVKRDVNRVNVAKLGPADNTEPAVTGGYLLKKDWFDTGDVTFTTSSASGYATTLTYVYPRCKAPPDTCAATAQQKTWITQYINDFETALKGPAFADPTTGYAKYIDADSFVDYYLLQELLKNSDGFRASLYMYKDSGGKLRMGPLWDMNFTMGNVGFSAARPTDGWLLGAVPTQLIWWSRLLQDPAFAQKVIARWQNLRLGPFNTSNMHATIDGLADKLRNAQRRNFARWPLLGTNVRGWNPPPVDPNETYADVIQQIRTWLDARTVWIDANIATIALP